MLETKIAPFYQARAKYLVDLLFDASLFKEGVTRDHMQSIEDMIAFEYQASADSAKRLVEILSRIKK